MKKVVPIIAVCGLLSAASAGHGQQKSLVIGIDGMGFGEQGFSVTATPWMDSLIDGSWQAAYNGAYDDRAFAGGVLGTSTQQATVSGPGWSTILTAVWTDRHGVTGNGSSFASGDYANNPPYLATLKEALPSLTSASYVYWPPIDDYIISSIDRDGDPTNDPDFHASYSNDSLAVSEAAAAIADVGGLDPDAVFVSVDLVDGAGHSCGSSGLCYRDAIQTADGYVGQLLTAVASRPEFATENWQIVVTSDHGHLAGGGHGGTSDLERTIPFIVASKELNQGPLPSLPQAVSHADVAPSVLDHFGIARPSHYWGVSRAFGAFIGNPDINGDGVITGDGSGPFASDDVTAFLSFWLQPSTIQNPNPADLNADGISNLADWAILNAELPDFADAVMRALHGPAVPEPTAAVAGLILITACGMRRLSLA